MALVARISENFVRADCLETDSVGDSVYITGDKVSNRYQVAKVDITDISKMPAIGVIVRKETTTSCTVQIGGVVQGVYTGLTPEETLVIATDSTLTETTPAPAPASFVLVQIMGTAVATDEVLLRVSPIPIKRNG